MREEIGDTMRKLKKAAAVAFMVGGIGMVGGGVASANAGGDFPPDVVIDNLQVVECEQDFDAGTLGPIAAPITGDQELNVGNSCEVVGSIED
ncbi:hypothetical protein ACFYOV_15615 [Streptomyces sp. NPDC005931]|uniref:hypothetical protein n=1 Tax=Streptomyces sp. NPDC005931 TaxID=3364737 RepID=UPI0036C493CC